MILLIIVTKKECYFDVFANSKKWGEKGKSGYGISDVNKVPERQAAAKEARTMGELAAMLRDRGLLFLDMRDYLGVDNGNDPTFCVYAWMGSGKQQVGTLSSNGVVLSSYVSQCVNRS